MVEDLFDEDWYRRWWKRMPSPWAVPEIEELMKEMEKQFMQFKDLENIVPKELLREKRLPDGSVRKEIGPIVYGYSMTIGPDRKPVVREFGNVKRGSAAPWRELTDKREPMVDVVDSGREIRVLAEVPGVRKEDINVTLEDRSLIISVDTENRKYHKQLELPETVRPSSAKSTYNNGILEITFEKESGERKGVRLNID